MYRAITYAALSHRLDFDDTAAVAALAETAVIRFEGRQVFLNDEDVTVAIRDPETSPIQIINESEPRESNKNSRGLLFQKTGYKA